MFRISGSINFQILVEDSGTGDPCLITVRMECLFGFQFWYCELCVKNWWGESRKHYFVNFCFVKVFNCRWTRDDDMGQKVFLRDIWNRIFCLLFLLKSWSVRGAACHPAFMVLVLIKKMRRGGGSRVSICYPIGLRASPQTYHERIGLI